MTEFTPTIEDQLLGGIIVGMMHNPESVKPYFKVIMPKHFSKDDNRVIFEALAALAHSDCPVDLVSIANLLWSNNQIWEAGGHSALAELWLCACDVNDIKTYAETLSSATDTRNINEAE